MKCRPACQNIGRRSHAEFDGLQILIGEIDIAQDRAKQSGLVHRLAIAAIGEGLRA